MADIATIRKRDELARLVLSSDDKDVIDKIFRYTKKLLTVKKNQTWDEVVESVEKQITAYEKGELKTFPHEEVLKIVEGWK